MTTNTLYAASAALLIEYLSEALEHMEDAHPIAKANVRTVLKILLRLAAQDVAVEVAEAKEEAA